MIGEIYIKNCFVGIIPDKKTISEIDTILERYKKDSYFRISQKLHITLFFIGDVGKSQYDSISNKFKLHNIKIPNEQIVIDSYSKFENDEDLIYFLNPDPTSLKTLSVVNKSYKNILDKGIVADEYPVFHSHLTLFHLKKGYCTPETKKTINDDFKNFKAEFTINKIYLMGKSVKSKFRKVEILG